MAQLTVRCAAQARRRRRGGVGGGRRGEGRARLALSELESVRNFRHDLIFSGIRARNSIGKRSSRGCRTHSFEHVDRPEKNGYRYVQTYSLAIEHAHALLRSIARCAPKRSMNVCIVAKSACVCDFAVRCTQKERTTVRLAKTIQLKFFHTLAYFSVTLQAIRTSKVIPNLC